MRIGILELCLLVVIAAIAFGPTVTLWLERWMRRAQKTSAAAARRRAAQEAQRAAEREAVLHRFQKLSLVFVLLMAAGLFYTLVLRPIESEPQRYIVPALRETASRDAASGGELTLDGVRAVSCIRAQEGWLYLSAQSTEGTGVLLRVREDGSGLTSILTVSSEITGFAFDAQGDLWLTVLTDAGGMLCRAGHDGWGATLEQVVSQIDGRALGCLTAVETGADGYVYFAEAAAVSAPHGAEAALRTELTAHTGTGSVYSYDPAARSVRRVLSGVAGAAGLAFAPDGGTLYVSDLGERCVWAVPPQGRELTAGGRECGVLAAGLPGYPGALAVDEEGLVYISYRWAYSAWLEQHTDGTLLRGAALRLRQGMQEGLFRLPSDAPSAETVRADGTPQLAFRGLGSTSAVCPAGSRVYFGISGQESLSWMRV
ncbi:MAG: SMP-30/gluconolactonase/LRE family protein [Faecalibacterium sp.]